MLIFIGHTIRTSDLVHLLHVEPHLLGKLLGIAET